VVLTEFELRMIWAQHHHRGGDVISAMRNVERDVLYGAAKVLESNGCPAEWTKILHDLIV
jgi:hypothetical protein